MTDPAVNSNLIQAQAPTSVPPNEPKNFQEKLVARLKKINISRKKIVVISVLVFLLVITLTGLSLLSGIASKDNNKNPDVEVVIQTKPSPKALSTDELKIEDFAKDLESQQTDSPNLDLPKLDYGTLYK